MLIEEFESGTWEQGFKYKYFVPSPINHAFSYTDDSLNTLLETASLRLGELNSFSRLVPDIDMFIRMHVLKEAVVSSRIEGTRTNIEEALDDVSSVDPERRDDWLEVNNYVKAMNSAIEELKTLPLSCRLIRDTHKILLSSGRGEGKTPGEFRTSQNWIGGANIVDAVFVPPAVEKLPCLLSDFEKFLNNDEINVPNLIKIAIAHYQFETIHPFLDGNGRIGRLLVTLFFVANKILDKPLLYLSAFLEKNRSLYYDKLTITREKNDLGQWIKFFLLGIIETAEDGANTLQKIMQIKAQAENKIISSGRRSGSAHKLLNALFTSPVVSIKAVQKITDLTPKASGSLINMFIEKGILREITERKRNCSFAFSEYLDLFVK
ncbi:Fic family protein [Treponema parvum]|uniref:Fic family protein n=2 Tax=Treponema parvum TaxID=138851 RepID=A0A975F6J0_9SPIR|nr:Fic family protein [Treponema parvum]